MGFFGTQRCLQVMGSQDWHIAREITHICAAAQQHKMSAERGLCKADLH